MDAFGQRFAHTVPAASAEGFEEKKEGGTTEKVYEVGKDLNLRARWKNGLWVETADEAFAVHVGGLIHVESGWWTADPRVTQGPGSVGPLEDGAQFRRARIHISGRMWETIEWAMEYGFENKTPQFYNVYADVTQLPWVGNFRVGHFREPFGLDSLTSYNNLTFLERALTHDAFVPFFNTGVMLHGPLAVDWLHYAAGVFRSNSDNVNGGDAGDGAYAYTSRLWLHPINEQRQALHLAAAYSYRVLPELNAQGAAVTTGGLSRFRYSAKPEFRVNAPLFADTGAVQAEHSQLVAGELGWSFGPFFLQAEYVAALPQDAVVPAAGGRQSLFFQGYYVQLSYFLTGESRPYVPRDGIFGQVKPNENFFLVRDENRQTQFGHGAWELAMRYSHLDLSNGGVEGGNLRDLTFGVNWYLNPNCRVLWNYLLIWRDTATGGGAGLTQAFGARFQIEF